MRELARGNSIVDCQKAVERYKSRGWKQITDIKLDDSMSAYGIIRYVSVMEYTKDKPKKGWNNHHVL